MKANCTVTSQDKTTVLQIMSLQCLSILGNKNEPLFFTKPPSSKKKDVTKEPELDSFGFLDSMDGESSSVDHEVCDLWLSLSAFRK